MRFSQEFIDATREAQGDEAANQLVQANAEEDHRTRVQHYQTDKDVAQKYPRMAYALKSGQVQLPSFPDDAAAEAYVRQQEEFLEAMKAPLPGQDQNAQTQRQNTQDAGENQGDQKQLRPEDLGRIPGMVPWSEGATQSVLTPSQPGPGASQLTIIVADAEALMDPEPGQFKRGRERDFQLIRAMEIANRMVGGTQELREMRLRFMDPDVFPL